MPTILNTASCLPPTVVCDICINVYSHGYTAFAHRDLNQAITATVVEEHPARQSKSGGRRSGGEKKHGRKRESGRRRPRKNPPPAAAARKKRSTTTKRKRKTTRKRKTGAAAVVVETTTAGGKEHQANTRGAATAGGVAGVLADGMVAAVRTQTVRGSGAHAHPATDLPPVAPLFLLHRSLQVVRRRRRHPRRPYRPAMSWTGGGLQGVALVDEEEGGVGEGEEVVGVAGEGGERVADEVEVEGADRVVGGVARG